MMENSCATEFRSVLSPKLGQAPDGTYRESTLGPGVIEPGHTVEEDCKMSGEEGLNLGGATTAEGESNGSTGSSNRGGGSNRREAVVVKKRYGTKFFDPDTSCEDHSRNAEGVLVIPEDSALSGEDIGKTVVMCRPCRESFEDRYGIDVKDHDYRRFNP